MENSLNYTPFSNIYDNFLGKITDDMYMELTFEQTQLLLKDLLITALYKFEFPKKNIFDYSTIDSRFNVKLNQEEVNIISTYMIVEWLGQQLASVEATRMIVSSSDFKFTSQANHLGKLLQLKKDYEREGFHLQRLYGRRSVDKKGNIISTIGSIVGREE